MCHRAEHTHTIPADKQQSKWEMLADQQIRDDPFQMNTHTNPYAVRTVTETRREYVELQEINRFQLATQALMERMEQSN